MKTWEEMTSQERDALVQKHVVGQKKVAPGFVCVDCLQRPCVCAPPYTTDISAAWEVVEKMREEGAEWTIQTMVNGVRGRHIAAISKGENEFASRVLCVATGQASSAPEAICLAALRAKGVEV